METATIALILQLAFSLLVQANQPGVPFEQKVRATNYANYAIETATRAMKPVGVQQTVQPTIQEVKPVVPVVKEVKKDLRVELNGNEIVVWYSEDGQLKRDVEVKVWTSRGLTYYNGQLSNKGLTVPNGYDGKFNAKFELIDQDKGSGGYMTAEANGVKVTKLLY